MDAVSNVDVVSHYHAIKGRHVSFMSTESGKRNIILWVVVSNIFDFHRYLGKISNLTDIFQMGWFNHQLVILKHPEVFVRPERQCPV